MRGEFLHARGPSQTQLTLAHSSLSSSRVKSEPSSVSLVCLDSGREAVGIRGPIPVGISSPSPVLLKHLGKASEEAGGLLRGNHGARGWSCELRGISRIQRRAPSAGLCGSPQLGSAVE